jgi:hypothetical protein
VDEDEDGYGMVWYGMVFSLSDTFETVRKTTRRPGEYGWLFGTFYA